MGGTGNRVLTDFSIAWSNPSPSLDLPFNGPNGQESSEADKRTHQELNLDLVKMKDQAMPGGKGNDHGTHEGWKKQVMVRWCGGKGEGE
jgi:hypothetical protein